MGYRAPGLQRAQPEGCLLIGIEPAGEKPLLVQVFIRHRQQKIAAGLDQCPPFSKCINWIEHMLEAIRAAHGVISADGPEFRNIVCIALRNIKPLSRRQIKSLPASMSITRPCKNFSRGASARIFIGLLDSFMRAKHIKPSVGSGQRPAMACTSSQRPEQPN